LRSFRSINFALARAVNWRLPIAFRQSFQDLYAQRVSEFANRLRGGCLVDVGAGFILPAARYGQLDRRMSTLGMDISEAALRKNRDVGQRLVADACQTWPLDDACADMVISRSVIEHLYDTEKFASECRRVLKPGGRSVHLLPGRNAPFSVLNRLLPNRVSQRLLYWAFPHKEEELGFPAYYQNCAYPAILELFARHGLEVESVEFRYYQSTYFSVFFPAYLVSLAYDLLIWKLGIRRLSSQLLVVLRRVD